MQLKKIQNLLVGFLLLGTCGSVNGYFEENFSSPILNTTNFPINERNSASIVNAGIKVVQKGEQDNNRTHSKWFSLGQDGLTFEFDLKSIPNNEYFMGGVKIVVENSNEDYRGLYETKQEYTKYYNNKYNTSVRNRIIGQYYNGNTWNSVTTQSGIHNTRVRHKITLNLKNNTIIHSINNTSTTKIFDLTQYKGKRVKLLISPYGLGDGNSIYLDNLKVGGSEEVLPITGMCGSAAKNYGFYDTSYTENHCTIGSVTPPIQFPQRGGSSSWTCYGSESKYDVTCTASRDGKPVLNSNNIFTYDPNAKYTPYNSLIGTQNMNNLSRYSTQTKNEKDKLNEGDPVTLSNGEFTYENTFMSVPGIGKPFEVKLNYKNQLYYNGVVGVNWDHNYNQYLAEEENGNVMYYNGKLGVFRFLKNENTYSYNEGLQATLVKNANDSWSIVYDSGEKINFNTDKKISNIIDKHGNVMKFEYLNGLLAKVTDTLNREYFYEYNANNKLSSVTDFKGNKVLFDYYNGSTGSGSENDLKEVTLLNGDKSKTISYEYTTNGDQTSNHNLTKLIDAKRQTYVENIYQDDRVITQKFGNGDINYEYTVAENGTVAKNKVTDRENHVTEYEYDNGKNTRMTIFTASGNLVYDYEYNDLGLISKEKRPKGNGFTFLYDAKGNMIEKRSKTQVDAENSSNDQVVTMTYNDQNKILTQTDALGNLSTFEYDQKGNLIKVQKEVSGETLTVENTYDNYGNISQTKDPQGNITTYTYFAGKLTKVSKLAKDRSGLLGMFEDDVNDIITQFEYDDYGNIVGKIDARGNKTSLTYNEFHNLIQTLSAENMLTKTEYDDTNNPIRSIFGSGSQRETLTEYNLLDKPSKTTINIDTDLKNIVEQTYDKNDNLKKVSYQNGSFITYEYDFSNKVIAKSITDSEGNTTTTQYAYDTNGNIIETTLPNGKKLQYQYDLFDRLIKEIDTLGNYKFYVYDKANRLTATQIWSGENVMLSEVINTYDEAGRVLESKVHDLEKNIFLTTTQSYDVLGQLVKTTNTLGHQTNFAYDEFQRLVSQTDALGNKVVSSYDKNGNVVKKTIVQNNGKTTQTLYSYDKDNKLVQETNHLGKTQNYQYDAFGQVEKITDENGNISRFEYNFVGNLTKEIQYLSGSAIELKSSYDAFGNKISATDENGNITRFEYDSLHRLVKEIYPDEKNITYTYDVYGNMISQKDPNGNILTYVYDDNFRVIEKNISRGENIKGTTKETYSYDTLSRLVEVKSFEGETLVSTLGFAYNQLNQLISETNNSKTVHYDYDTLGNMVKITYPNGNTIEKSYDEIARLKTIAKDTSALVSYTYDGIALVQTQLQNGAKTLTTQDELLRTKTLNHTVGETTLKNYTYTYDDVSNILSTGEKTYQYDSLYRLSQETQNTGVFEYAYDPAGNRTSSTTSSGTLTYQSNILNQYASISLGDKNIAYTYDKNGNLIEDENFQYMYDYKNRIVEVIKKATSTQTGTGSNEVLQSFGVDIENQNTNIFFEDNSNTGVFIEDPSPNVPQCPEVYEPVCGIDGVTYPSSCHAQEINILHEGVCNSITSTPEYSMITYSYDATGRRFAKVVKDASGAILENISYTYAGEQVIEETSGTTQKAFFYGNAGVDDMVAFTQNNQTYFLHKDHLGSTLAISDISANIITTYDYDAYGNVSLTSGSQAFQNDRLFTGREYEKETGLYYYRARFYSPKTGRFLSRDPIGIQDDVNLYAYVGNNPVMFTDPMGKEKKNYLPTQDATHRFLEYIEKGKKFQYSLKHKIELKAGIGPFKKRIDTPFSIISDTLPTYLLEHKNGGEYDIKRNDYFKQNIDIDKFPGVDNNQTVLINGIEFKTSELGNFFVGLNGERAGLSLDEINNYGMSIEQYQVIKGTKKDIGDELIDQKYYSAGYHYSLQEKSKKLNQEELNNLSFYLLKKAQDESK